LENIDRHTVEGFGAEWSQFDQSRLSSDERERIFGAYFRIFPWHALSLAAVGIDVGCGSGRWAQCVAPRVERLHCIDASMAALDVARRNLAAMANCEFHHASVASIPLPDASMDFGYSLGVLHHVPDTRAALAECARCLKPGAPFLVYLYYRFDNRPVWFRAVWRSTDVFRRVVCRLPFKLRYAVSQVVAATVYLPLTRFARVLEWLGVKGDSFPLSSYRRASFYTLRTDALDRFGTRLEQRFTRDEIEQLMASAGFEGVEFSPSAPFWCAVGYRRRRTPSQR
jgi:ubiquinone/menaquinone biosynthesis C-methylase UbiE